MKNTILKIFKWIIDPGKKDLYFKIILALILFFWNFYLSTDKYRKQKLNFKVGDIAPYDIKINKDMEYIDYTETRKNIQSLISNVTPIFTLELSVLRTEKQNLSSLFTALEKIDAQPSPANEKIREFKKMLLVRISGSRDDEMISRLFPLYKNNGFQDKLADILDSLYNTGITELNTNDINLLSRTGEIIKAYSKDSKEQISLASYKKDIYYFNELNYSELVKRYYPNLSSDKTTVLAFLLGNFIRPNLFFSKDETDKKIVSIINAAKPVKKKLKQGQVLVRYGQEITESDFNILKEIVKSSTETNIIDGYFIYLLLIFVLIFFLVKVYIHEILDNHKTYIFILSFIFLAITLNYFFIYFNNFFSPKLSNSHFIPIAGFSILIASLTSAIPSYFVIFFLSILTVFISGFNYIDFIVILFVGIFTLILSRNLKKRSHMWYLGLLIGVFYMLLSIGNAQINNLDRNLLFNLILIGFINGIVSVLLAIGLYPLFENLFNIVTDYRLIELSDLNLPIMKKLLIEA
ncbi:MAG: hypothetical protein PHF84_08425, partial [bacterium]|nr:hypothetical protein [bacterium]